MCSDFAVNWKESNVCEIVNIEKMIGFCVWIKLLRKRREKREGQIYYILRVRNITEIKKVIT